MAEQETPHSRTKGRPVPDIPPAPDERAAGNEQQLDLDSDPSSGGRRHAPASVSKTSFTANTPASQKRAMQWLKQSLTYSDNSSQSSAASTPHKSSGTVQSGQGSTHSLRGSTHSAPPIFTTKPAVATPPSRGDEGEGSEYVSEGEASTGISVTAIIAKLDQVKEYLKEAEDLHMQMKERLSEPGMMTQVTRMGKLVEDLKRQEAGYLSILLKLLDQESQADSAQMKAGENEEGSEEEGSEGEMPSEVGQGGGEEEEDLEEAGTGNDSMSLKAELLKEQMLAHRAEQERQEEELRMLRQQRDLLKTLLQQQKQIEDLEERQKKHQKSDAVTARSQTGEDSQNPVPLSEQATADGGDKVESPSVASRLEKLKESQARVEQLSSLLSVFKTEDGKESQLTATSAASDIGNTVQPQEESGSSELVAVGEQAMPAELVELQNKLKQTREATARLAKLQDMLTVLQEEERDGPKREEGSGRDLQEQQQQEQPEKVEENHTESDVELEQSVLAEYEERLVRRRREVRELQEQRDQLLATQRRLQELQQSMTLSVHKSDKPTVSAEETRDFKTTSDGGGGHVLSPHQLASELGRQRRLYDDLLDKTQQIQSMVDEVAGARDETVATWGGSSLPSSGEEEEEEEEEEEGEREVTSVSLTGRVGELDDTRDDLDNMFTLGDSAVAVTEQGESIVHQSGGGGKGGREGGGEGEGVVFRVTRHTPRRVRGGERGGHRRVLTPEASLHSAGKRMKLDQTPFVLPRNKGSSKSSAGATVGSCSVAWPSFISPSKKSTREEGTQTGGVVSSGTVPPQPSSSSLLPQPALMEHHVSFLQYQLATTSSLAAHLLSQQQGLISTVCRQLDSLQLQESVQDHFRKLHQYQAELEQYYSELQTAFLKPQHVVVDEDQREVRDEEEEEEVERDEEEPIFPSHHPSHYPTIPTTGPSTSSTMAGPSMTRPSMPVPPQPLPFQPGEPHIAFSQQKSGNPFQQVPTVSGGSSGPQGPPERGPLLSGVPSAARAYYPQVYQQVEREGEVLAGAESGYGAPLPPPLPSYLHHPSPYTQYPPWVPPTPLSSMNHPQHPHSGLGYPPYHHHHHHPSPGLLPPSSFFRSPYSHPWPPHNLPGVSSMYPGGYYGPDQGALSASATGYGLDTSNHSLYPPHPTHHHMMGGYGVVRGGGGGEGGEGGEVGGRLYSPSGVTGVSMQVQPPSSPPSAPSLSNLQPSSLGDNNTGSGVLPPSSSTTLLAPTSSASHVGPTTSHSLPKLTPHTLPTLTSSASGNPPLVISWEGGDGERGSGRERGEERVTDATQDEEVSLSSMPLSLPGENRGESVSEGHDRPPEDFSVFDALRDTIYSEVATLIANNENRPHFLVELFRELQMLSSDYLRQRALFSLQDLVTRYLTEETLQQRQRRENTAATATGGLVAWVGSEPTPSESLVTSEDEVMRPPPTNNTTNEGVESELSATPPNETPFAADNIGDTVVRLDKAMAKLRESYGVGAMVPPVVTPGPLASASQQTPQFPPEVNMEQLDEQIKAVMTEVIPLLKEHMAESCSSELLEQIRQLVTELILGQLEEQASTILDTFSKQLDASLQTTLHKYLNVMLKECGEALLVEVSEVLFNELAFFRLMQTMGVQKHPHHQNVVAQSETGGDGRDERESEVQGKKELVKGEGGRDGVPPCTAAVLQALSSAVAKTMSDEQEALGKSRDDELAREWSAPHEPPSPSIDDEPAIVVELSASESKPIHSAGSGDEAGEGAGIATTTSPQEVNSAISAAGEREETPPTPLISAVPAVTNTISGDTNPLQSPPPHLSNAVLEVQMKAEQQSTEGIAGILATIVQEQELAGESDQLPQPTAATPSEAVAEP